MSNDTNTEKKLFLLDAFALIFRAHYAFIKRPLINSKGINTSAITGFVNALWEVLQKEKPTHLAVCFDLSGPTFRHEMYEPYKANRDETPEDIIVATPIIKEIIKGFNLPIISKAGFEADDVIGTLAKKAAKEGYKVFMMTPDKDFAQLVEENILIYKPNRQGKGVVIQGVKEVCEDWKIKRVDQVIDVLGLQGDAVDNIPGVPGIGPKTAQKLLAEFDNIANIIKNADKLKGKQKERITQYADQAILSRKLAVIDTNVPVDFVEKDCRVEEFNKEKLAELFKELEFRSISKRILGDTEKEEQGEVQRDLFGNVVAGSAKPKAVKKEVSYSLSENNMSTTEQDYQLVSTPEKRAELIALLAKQKSFCFDTETTGIDPNEAELVGMSFAVKAKEAFYVPVPANQEEAKAIVAEFKEVFENEAIEKTGQNIKYDILMLKWYGVNVKGKFFDTMLAHYLLEPDLRHGLDYLSETYLSYKPVSITTLIGKKGKNQLSMRDIDVEKVSDYAAEDADLTLRLKEHFTPLLKEYHLDDLYNDLESKLIEVLAEIEYAGVNVNTEVLNEYSKQLGKEILEKEQSIYKNAGTHFNIASPKQVGEVLFDRLKIPYRWRRTKTGQYSTNEEKLTELAQHHDVVNMILQYRKLAKLKSTYVDALPQMVNPKTKRIHTSYNQARAATGRLSSENPNLQNIPIKDAAGRKIREAFIPRSEEYILLAADYSQIELRLIAAISKDEAMLEAFREGVDIHTATAAKVYEVELDEVTADQRRNAKTVNFSIIYGAGATNLSKNLGIKRKEAQKLIEQYFKQYNGLKGYMDGVVEKAREDGFVTTLMGRRRYLRDINSQNGMTRSQAERNAVNTPIQGSAADMIKRAMITIQGKLKAGNFKTKMIMQVHDELVFDVFRPELEQVKPIILEGMKNAIPNLGVPIEVSMDTGENWLEAH